jgi:hypothetical protein
MVDPTLYEREPYNDKFTMLHMFFQFRGPPGVPFLPPLYNSTSGVRLRPIHFSIGLLWVVASARSSLQERDGSLFDRHHANFTPSNLATAGALPLVGTSQSTIGGSLPHPAVRGAFDSGVNEMPSVAFESR